MTLPLLVLPSAQEYQKYFDTTYCSAPIITFDSIPVYFDKIRFSHAFFESTQRNGQKDVFSNDRAQRMSWIAPALQDSSTIRYQGWNRKIGSYDPAWRVAVIVQDFVVVIRLKAKQQGLVGDFMTCYKADNSIGKISQSPLWDEKACKAALGI
ncbi:hypothetical protein [Desulfovibrio desulfuricans]|uniref:hypothetical protein n=1 Tax=Desulfovibrio desulfuricans TaxID=876 RepID=UPI0035AF8CB4